jgi:hypothetical protein
MSGTSVLRIGFAIVFGYFSVMQFIDPASWIGYLPAFLQGPNALMLIYANALLDLVLAITIGLAIFPRIAPLVGTIHLLGIAVTMGFNEIAVRDFGLAMACLALVFIREEHISSYQRRIVGKLFNRH